MKPLAICALSAVLCAVPASAGTLVIGLPADVGNGNCFPFSCYSGSYQQVYNSGQFPGTITITSLDFYNTEVNELATSTDSGNFLISLSTTSADWNTLSPTYAANLGSDNTTVFNGSILQPWAFGDTLVIDLTTPFTYNPASGNLLLTLDATGTSTPGGQFFFDSNGYNGGDVNGDDFLGRVFGGGTSGYVNSGYGLVTGFGENTAATPEPSSLILLGSGLFGALGMIRRKIKG